MPAQVILLTSDNLKLQCNVSCGKGFRQRDVLCRSVSGGELPDKACKGKQLDATIEICFGYKCGRGFGDNTSPRWRTSRWSTVSTIYTLYKS